MRKKNWLEKTVAFFISLILITQTFPISSFATDHENNIAIEKTFDKNVEEYIPDIIEEVVELRDEYTKHFRREDGSFVAAMYSEPVHYQKGGEWKAINNELKVHTNTESPNTINEKRYTITETSTPISFPDDINKENVKITKNNNIISFRVKNNTENTLSTALASPEELQSFSRAKMQPEELSDKNEEKLVADTKTSAITYSEAFENASLEYEVSSSIVKESIVVGKRSDSYVYEFLIDFGSFVPVYDKNTGGINIYETKQSDEPVMAIAPPYMFDANGATSFDVSMSLALSGSEYILTVTADANWINDKARVFPVTVDPTFILDLGRSAVHDVHVNQNKPNKNYNNDYQLEVGRNNNNVFRTYIRYDLPDLPDCSVITNAELTLIQNWARNFEATDLYLNVYECESEWNEDTIVWNNQPVSDLSQATIIDYTNYVNGMSAEYNLNITKIVKNWYEYGENYGLMLASSDETVEEKTSFYSSRNIISSYPVVIINYVNNNGIESYWDYEAFSTGKSGTAYVNTYNGGLTYVHSDASTNGLLAPVSVSHIYSIDERAASGELLNMKFGKGFKLNVIEKIEASNVNNYPYKYIDADGTVHYFMRGSSSNQYVYEFDSNTVLTRESSGYILTFIDGSQKNFNADGYLTQTTDINGNTVSVNYSNGQIIRVTDGGGKTISFSYNDNKTLKTVSDSAGRSTNYTYNADGNLSQITYPDGTKTQYSYDTANSLLCGITSNTNDVLELEYKEVVCSTKTYFRVSSVAVKGNNEAHTELEKISFEYRPNGTVVSNSKGDKNELVFDNSGRLTSCFSNEKNISVAEYNSNGNKNNSLAFASNSFTPSENLGKRQSQSYYREHDSAQYQYYNIYDNNSTERVYNQHQAYKIGVKPGYGAKNNYVYKYTLPHDAGKTYTYSVYVNIVDTLQEGNVHLKAKAYNSNNELIEEYKSEEIVTTQNGWQLLTVTVTIPENTHEFTLSCGIFEGIGTVYVEDFNYTQSDVYERINLLQNSSFEAGKGLILPFTSWNGIYDHVDYCTNSSDGSWAAEIEGNPNAEKFIFQDLPISGKQGDILVFGARAQALSSASGNNGTRFFGVVLKLKNNDAVVGEPVYLPFNKDAYNVMQQVLGSATAAADYDEITIELRYDYEINKAVFDDAFVYRDYFGTSYSYDNTGKITSVQSDSGQNIAYTYNGNNIATATASYFGETTQAASYSYDASGNLLSSVGNDGVAVLYTYPETGSRGLPVSVTVLDSSLLDNPENINAQNSSTTTYEYYENYNYLKSVTEATGAKTEYIYDYIDDDETPITKGLVTAVIDPNGNRTNYTYDSDNDNLLSVSNPSQELGNPSTQFTYTNGNVTGISSNGAEYLLSYDMFGRPSETEINSLTAMTTTYNSDGQLSRVDYGNGDYVEYSYDDDYNLAKIKWNGYNKYEYSYNSQGQIGRLNDYDNNVVWDYSYDLAGRATGIEGSNGTLVDYGYDEKGNLARFEVSDSGSPLLNMQYSYDEFNRPSAVTSSAMSGSPVQSYSYDTLGRTQSISSIYNSANTQNKITSNYSYVTGAGGQTGRVSSVEYVKTTANGSTALLPTTSYTYDLNGNITHIHEGGVLKAHYYYDGLNRLAREDNGYIGKTIVYEYNSGGDILSRTEYALTNSEALGEAVNVIEYRYDDLNHLNGVTLYDETDIIGYDTLGTPTVYRDYQLAWDKGKQLTAMNSAENSLLFGYDASGLRTWRIVNQDYTEYTYIGTTLVSQNTNGEVINFSYTASGAPYGFTLNGTSYFYLLNLQGDVIGIYDSNGNIVVQYVYDSWGKLISITGSLADTVGVKNPLRYRGYYYDTLSGLYYLQSRYYDPETGRFISSDTLLIAGNDTIQGTNLYAYCYNNPIMYSDPSGYYTKIINIFSNLLSKFSKKKCEGSGEFLSLAWLMFLNASEDIGFALYDGRLNSIKTEVKSSGVVEVVLSISGKLTKNGTYNTYIVEMYYGNNSEWALENVNYKDESKKINTILALSGVVIGTFFPTLSAFVTIIDIAMIFSEDDYQNLIDDILIESAKNPGANHAKILYITDTYTCSYIYSY